MNVWSDYGDVNLVYDSLTWNDEVTLNWCLWMEKNKTVIQSQSSGFIKYSYNDNKKLKVKLLFNGMVSKYSPF